MSGGGGGCTGNSCVNCLRLSAILWQCSNNSIFLNRQLCISDKCWRASWRCKFYRWPRNTIWTDSDNWRVSWSSAFRSLVRSREVRNPRLPATCCCTPCRPYPMIRWLDPDCRNQATLPNKSNPHDRAVWYWPLPEWSSYHRFLFHFPNENCIF